MPIPIIFEWHPGALPATISIDDTPDLFTPFVDADPEVVFGVVWVVGNVSGMENLAQRE
jgi:hypothetical protein